MERMDYRELCLELFGTDDENELRRIAEQVSKKNSRGEQTEEGEGRTRKRRFLL